LTGVISSKRVQPKAGPSLLHYASSLCPLVGFRLLFPKAPARNLAINRNALSQVFPVPRSAIPVSRLASGSTALDSAVAAPAQGRSAPRAETSHDGALRVRSCSLRTRRARHCMRQASRRELENLNRVTCASCSIFRSIPHGPSTTLGGTATSVWFAMLVGKPRR
jgi:hypothetical protein